MNRSIDEVLVDLALVRVEGELSDEAHDALVAAAEAFYRAGGVWAWADWARLAPATQAAFTDARETVEAERLAVLARVMGAKAPRARRNPTAPENLPSGEDADQAVVSDVAATMAAVIAERSAA